MLKTGNLFMTMKSNQENTASTYEQPVRIGLPVEGEGKTHRRISSHFGRAESVLLVEKRSGDTAVIENGSERCGQGGCGPVDVFISFGVDAVICQNLGGGALARLIDARIAVYQADTDSVEAAIDAFSAGRLPQFDPGHVCHNHSHKDDHTPCGHDHGHSHG